MTTTSYATAVHLDEDTVKQFEIPALLQQAGYTPTGIVAVISISYIDRAGQVVTVPSDLMQMVDGDTLQITANGWPDWFGEVTSFTLVIDNGITRVPLQLQVVIDPVNDAPAGTDKAITLPDGNAYVLKESDFGFTDPADGHAFKSVLISDPPAMGKLLLNGVAVTAGTEVGIEDVRAGLLSYVPSANASGTAVFGFQVRDDGGTAGNGSVDLDPTPNYISFCVPAAVLGDRVWLDTNGNGVQDTTEVGLSGVTVTVRGAGADGSFGTADDTTASTITNASGNYQFANLQAGSYQLQIGSASGYVFSARDQGSNDALDSDVDAAGASGIFTLAAGQTNLTLDAGVRAVKASTLCGTAWVDANGNGVRDSGEAVQAGVAVSVRGAGLDGLFNTADDAVVSTVTAANGSYSLGGLANGQYRVSFAAPAGQSFTGQDVGTNDAIDSDVDTTGQSAVIALGVRQAATVDAGLLAPCTARVGDKVWHDANGNGLQDTGEAGIGGIAVKLTGAGKDNLFGTADDTTAATTTDATGAYAFGSLAAGQYKVTFGTRAGLVFTTRDVGTNDSLDSDVDAATGVSQVVTLAVGQVVNTVDAGYKQVKTSSIGDKVWKDANFDGIQQATESGAAGVTVQLRGAGLDGVFGTADDVSATTVTSSTGSYGFTGLAAGQYAVSFGTLAGYGYTAARAGTSTELDSDADAVTGQTAVFSLGAAQALTGVDAGLAVLRTASIGDRVWHDANGNGRQDAGELGIGGVQVKLTGNGADGLAGTADDVSVTTTTGADGSYRFSQLAAGTYNLAFTAAAGLSVTTQNVGPDDLGDSDADALGKVSVTVGSGVAKTDVDVGYTQVKTSAMTGRVWDDLNGNGLQDTSEQSVAGVNLTLRGAGIDGTFGTADDVTVTTTTDFAGYYRLNGLAAGSYTLAAQAPAGFRFTTTDALSNTRDTLDSDVDSTTGVSSVFTLAPNATRTDVAVGVTEINAASFGDRVWLDANGNGLQDAGEVGIAGVQVKLFSAGVDGQGGTADDVNRTVTTDATGAYRFDALRSGQYTLSFTAPTGLVATTANVGSNDEIDSDVGSTGQVVLQLARAQAAGVDAGFQQVKTGLVANSIWNDANGNGLRDSGELGQAGVKVQLSGAGFDGVFGTADDVLASTTTDANGNYRFDGLAGGNYVMSVTPPLGYKLTTKDALGNTRDTTDSDVDAVTGRTDVFTLASGGSRGDISAGVTVLPSATIVGDSVIQEQYFGSYRVKLSLAVAYDTTYYIRAVDGTAGRTEVSAGGQYMYVGGPVAGGYYYHNTFTDETGGVHVITDSTALDLDYALRDVTGRNVGAADGFYVTVKAGQTSSAAFTVDAWKEYVVLDKLTQWDIYDFNAPLGTKDGIEARLETFSLQLSAVDTGAVSIYEPNKLVSIQDGTTYSIITPIVLDMDGNGIETTALAASTGTFDLLGTGYGIHSGWISAGDAFLAVDVDGNGRIDDISELFGGNKGDGFAKLASFDGNADGLVDAQDAGFAQLLVWQDSNGNHATDEGELRTLAEAGIASLDTAYVDQAIEQNGNVLGEASTATRTDGSSIDMVDVYFNVAPTTEQEWAAVETLTDLQLMLDDGNALLDAAFGSSEGVTAEGQALTAAWAEAGDATRQLIAAMRLTEGHLLASTC